MTPETDLLGAPLMRRSAFFPWEGQRERLTREWGGGPRALTIGCNPSYAGGDREDITSCWWNAWFRQAGFGAYDAANLYPFITPSPALCRSIADWEATDDWFSRDCQQANLKAVVRMAKGADQVFVCWGNIAWDNDWIEHVVEEIQTGVAPYPDLWCWGKTKSGAPTHPAARGKHRLAGDVQPLLWRAA